MIIPSIDIMNGQAVQLIGGKEMAIEAGDPFKLVSRFALAGEIAVIDLDAAMGKGDNEKLISEIVSVAPCRVGGGIRTADSALKWLDRGAKKVILGTRAVPEVLSQLPPERTVAALDAHCGEVVADGWQTKTGFSISERVEEIRDLVGEFMVTFVEREGRMQGIDLAEVRRIKELCGKAKLTVAGGVTTIDDVATIDEIGADAQVGMAIYTGKMNLADAIIAPLLCKAQKASPPNNLWPTVVVDERGSALGLVWSSLESVRESVDTLRGVYQSRSRGLWRKGETSGAIQDLLEIKLDCDRDAILFRVKQHGKGFCHLETKSCWGDALGLDALSSTILSRMQSAPAGSYTSRLFSDSELLNSKLTEEASELAEASVRHEVMFEAADVLYFALVKMAKFGVSLADVERELGRRALKVTRRPGDAKPNT